MPTARIIADMPNAAPSEQVAIVDVADRVIDSASRFDMRAQRRMHRANYILVFNRKGELLAQRRSANKDVHPGRLDFAAGGVVQFGEEYHASAVRELQEELGIAPPLVECFDIWFEDETDAPPNRHWGRVFSCVHDGPFTLQAAEIVDANFMRIDDALAHPLPDVTPDSRLALLAHCL